MDVDYEMRKIGFEISRKRRGMSQNEHGTGRESKYYPAADF
jgi:hypothetical protein